MTAHSEIKLPRLYIDDSLKNQSLLELSLEQTHYLRNVMRLNVDDHIRLFNGKDGEWLAGIQEISKKSASVMLEKRLKEQPEERRPLHLLFAPIKKQRLDILIEKAVELGISDLHPILTHHTENRKINEERIHTQIIEASEQCERLDIPTLHPLMDLNKKLNAWPVDQLIYAAIERFDVPLLNTLEGEKTAFLIGPEGGFDENERSQITNHSFVKAVSLGETVLRAETAAIACLCMSA